MDKFEEVREYKKLCDEGIISPEEFSAIKDRLLGFGEYENEEPQTEIEVESLADDLFEYMPPDEFEYDNYKQSKIKSQEELIVKAIEEGKEDEAVMHMASLVDPNFEYVTEGEFGENRIPLLYLAAEAGFVKLVESLISAGANVDAEAIISTENGTIKRPVLYGAITGKR